MAAHLTKRSIGLIISLLSLLTLLSFYTLFLHYGTGIDATVFGNTSSNPPPVTIQLPKKKENKWTARMIKSFMKDKTNIGTRDKSTRIYQREKQRDYIPKPFRKNKASPSALVNDNDNDNDNPSEEQVGETYSENFNFIVGMDAIQQEYDKVISNLKPMNISYRGNDKCSHQGRVFVIGIMKTGTTSMTGALAQLGYRCTHNSCIHLGNWFHFIDSVHLFQPLEVMILSILNMTDLFNDYLKETRSALAYGDSPWCFLYPVWDKLYPDSKYILMSRKDDQTYINSYLRYLKKFGKKYANKGLTDQEFALLALRRYQLHNQMVREYFKNRTDDLLEIVVGENKDDEWSPITEFLGCKKPARRFPHENKSNRGGMRKSYHKLEINENDEWDWNKTWGDDIVYLTRNDRDQSHTLVSKPRDEFVMDWNVFVVPDKRVARVPEHQTQLKPK